MKKPRVTLQSLFTKATFNSSSPLYLQLALLLENAIKQDIFDSDFLPSERELAKLSNLSRVTVSRALEVLKAKSLIIQQQGIGTQINKQLNYSLNQLSGFTQRMNDLGFTVSDNWIKRTIIKAPLEIAKLLNLPEHSSIAYLHRVRLIDNIPISIEQTYIPSSFLPEPEKFSGSLYHYWSKRGIYPAKKMLSFSTIKCNKKSAILLNQPKNFPLLTIQEINRDYNGQVIEVSRVQCVSEYFDLKIEA